MLFTLSYSPWKCDIKTMLRIVKKEDDLLLIQDGVLGAIAGNYFIEIFMKIPITISALKADIDARGISSQISTEINIIGYDCFVDLVVKHTSQISW